HHAIDDAVTIDEMRQRLSDAFVAEHGPERVPTDVVIHRRIRDRFAEPLAEPWRIGLLQVLERGHPLHPVEPAGFQGDQSRILVVDHAIDEAIDPAVTTQGVAWRPEA